MGIEMMAIEIPAEAVDTFQEARALAVVQARELWPTWSNRCTWTAAITDADPDAELWTVQVTRRDGADAACDTAGPPVDVGRQLCPECGRPGETGGGDVDFVCEACELTWNASSWPRVLWRADAV
jgi:hypothetical protein